jgi:hypothetical protein
MCAALLPAGAWGQDQTQLAKRNIERLQLKLQEFESGKRSDRDGYIILRLLLNNHEVMRTADGAEAQELRERIDRLIAKHPEFRTIKDERLSDEIAADKTKRDQRGEKVQKARSWTPADRDPVNYAGAGKSLAVRYQFKIEFYTLPSDVSLDIQPGPALTLTKQEGGQAVPVKLADLRPHKTLTFQQSFEMLPRMVEGSWNGPLLVCSHTNSRYGVRGKDEREFAKVLGHRNNMPYINRAGELKDFCGAISLAGEILFRSPTTATPPSRVLAPVGVAQDGRVAIAVGSTVKAFDGDETAAMPGAFREVFIWRQGQELRRIPLNPPVGRLYDLEVKFFRNEF